jgi:casein kinase I family protein HRR25
MTTPPEILCRGFPMEFATFLNYSRQLRYDEDPDYAYCRKLFRDLLQREGMEYDYVFDWSVVPPTQENPAIVSEGMKGEKKEKVEVEVEQEKELRDLGVPMPAARPIAVAAA